MEGGEGKNTTKVQRYDERGKITKTSKNMIGTLEKRQKNTR